jgi:hypothetical protein
MSKLKLGATVRDAVTGLTGIATQWTEFQSGTIQLAVQPPNKKGENTLPDAHNIDIQLLDYVDEGLAARVTKPTAVPIPLGSIVEDTVTGMKGTAVRRVIFINGCVYYDVVPKKKSAMFDDNPTAQFVDGTRLKVITPAVVEPRVEVRTRPPGGPSRPVMRQKVSQR